jgi:cyclohexanone monooxygenase
MVKDSWTSFFTLTYEILGTNDHPGFSDKEIAAVAEIADFQKGNEIRARVDATVTDPETSEALKPWYGQWCKRPTFSDDYLPTFNRPNVKLIDTDGKGVDRITENAAVVDGVEYEVDCLVYATGFEVGTAYTRRAECEIYGRDGLTLTDYWADGMKTFHGFLSQGFPNLFHMGLTQTGLAFNFTFSLNGQAIHIAHLVEQAMKGNAKTIEPTAEDEAAWVDLVSAPGPMRKYQELCTPGYYNSEGKNQGQSFLDNLYPEGAVPFFRMLAGWRERGGMVGLRTSP